MSDHVASEAPKTSREIGAMLVAASTVNAALCGGVVPVAVGVGVGVGVDEDVGVAELPPDGPDGTDEAPPPPPHPTTKQRKRNNPRMRVIRCAFCRRGGLPSRQAQGVRLSNRALMSGGA